MKNNYKYLFFVFLFFFLKINSLYSDEFTFEAPEIQILDNGNKVVAINGVKILSDDGVKINAENVKYDKINLTLVAEGKVKMFDEKNQIIINAPKVIYYKKEDIILTEGKTSGVIESIYNLETDNIVIDRKKMEVASESKSIIKDKENNILELMEFKYLANEKLIKGKEIKFTNKIKDEFFFKDAFIDISNNEIAGRNIIINFHNAAFNNPDNEPRLKGNIASSNENFTKVSKGVFTTCKKRDGCPPWQIHAEEVMHDKTKKILNYKKAWLKVYDIPVLYFPKFYHPDPTVKRQSGFLVPKYKDSKSLGSSLDIPYYHVISNDKDLTFKPRLYTDKKYIINSEFRSFTKNSKHVVDVSFMKGHEGAFDGANDNRSHFFSNSVINLDLNAFDYSELKFDLQRTSNDNYLKMYKLDSPLINNYGYLTSSLAFEANKEDLSLKTNVTVYEDLTKKNSDRYEFIYPSFDIIKNLNINEKYDGNLSLTSSGYQKNYDTNRNENVLINDLLYESNPNIMAMGLKNDYKLLFKNVNTDADNSTIYEDETNNKLLGLFVFNSSYPLKKENLKSFSFLTPKVSLRYSPSPTRNIKNEDKRIDINNIYSLQRIDNNDTVEGGQSITIGTEYKRSDKDNNDLFSLNLAKVYRDKINEDLPTKSTIGEKDSDIVGNLKFFPNKNLDINYDFSLDNNLKTTNFHQIKTEIKINNFATNFEYLEENNLIGTENYITNETSYNFNNDNSISFSTRRNKKTHLTEFYNLIYQYKNDCLIAAVEYNKQYYDDNEIKPEEQIYFSLTIVPFGKTNSPNLNQ